MHILFIGYGKTSQRLAKQLFEQGHQITTISRSPKFDPYATHLIQDVQQADFSQIPPVDWVYILLSPDQSTAEAYQQTYVSPIESLAAALSGHPVKRIVVVSSTRVYGEQAGQEINDETTVYPCDEQGFLLQLMELKWQAACPEQVVVVRPTGIYGTSVARMQKLAQSRKTYPDLHYSNRIHIDDLVGFLALLICIETPQLSYIVTDNRPLPLPSIIQWFQQRLGLPILALESQQASGKQVYASRMLDSGFQLNYPDCFQVYADLLSQSA